MRKVFLLSESLCCCCCVVLFCFIRIGILVYSVMDGYYTLTVALEKERKKREGNSITKSKHVLHWKPFYSECSSFSHPTPPPRSLPLYIFSFQNIDVNMWSVDNSPAESHHREYNNRGQFTSGKSPPRI